MSLVAGRTVTPSAEDVPDTDDGGEKVTAGSFWPEIALSDVRMEMRINGAVTTSRLKQVFSIARAHILGTNRDVDTTGDAGEKRAAALASQADDMWRDARWAISDIRGTVRNSAEAF